MPEDLQVDIPEIGTIKRPRRPVFQLPPEHGVLVAFILSCILAWKVAGAPSQEMDLTVMFLMLTVGSLHRPVQMAFIAFTGALILAFNYSQPWLALCLLLMPVGQRIANESVRFFGPSIRQTLGMLGISTIPLAAACLVSRGSQATQIAVLGFTSASMLSTGIVLLYQNKANIHCKPALLSATALWLWLLFKQPPAALLGFFPFLLQTLWIARSSKPTFKQIGIAESLCLSWTTAILFLQTG